MSDESKVKEIERMFKERTGVNAKFVEVTKNNDTVAHGFVLGEGRITPVVYVDLSGNLEVIVNWLVDEYNKCDSSNIPNDVYNLSKEFILDNVVKVLVSATRNRKVLQTCVHREFLDLAVVYRVILSRGFLDKSIATIAVTKEIMEKLNISFDELEAAANKNLTADDFLTVSLKDLLVDFADTDVLDVMEDCRMKMFVVTTKSKMYGGSALLFSSIYKGIAEQFQDDVYLIPSSIHEIICCPVNGTPPEAIREIIMSVNNSVVESVDVLSDSVYKYVRKKGKVVIC